jgi:cellulose synthase (UDP-forming)
LARGWLVPGLTGELAALTSDLPLLGRPRSRSDVAGDVTGVLPVPPHDTEKYGYARRRVWLLTCCSLISFSCLTVSQFRLAQASPWLWAYLPLLGFSVLYYLISLRVNAFSQDFNVRGHRRLVSSWSRGPHPKVDVFLPVCGEPIDVIRNTWTHVKKMVRTYPGVAVPLVLDDKNDPRCAELALELGFRYGSRPNRGWFKKAGNLRFGFENSDGKYILILDADFAPRADMLNELVPYLESDPRLAIVQSPQFFRILDQQNWIERGAGAVQELFYRSVQVSRQGGDGAICVGSCALYRRTALAQNGGTTLIEHSEDVHTGFDLRRLGWDLRYVPVALSTGLCPDTVQAFQSQQYRWCSGSLSLLLSKKFWQTRLRPVTRMCYMSGFFYYLHTAMFTFVGPMVPITLLLLLPERINLANTGLVIPSLVYATVIFPAWHRCSYRLEAWATRMMYGWAHVFAIWDLIRRRQKAWQPTGAASSGGRRKSLDRFRACATTWGGGTALIWVGAALWRMSTLSPVDYGLVLAGGLFYALTVARMLIPPQKRGC